MVYYLLTIVQKCRQRLSPPPRPGTTLKPNLLKRVPPVATGGAFNTKGAYDAQEF